MTTSTESPDCAAHIVARLFQLAQVRPHALALTTVNADGERRFDYAELAAQVRALAARLQQAHAPGERALLLLDNDHHYVIAFLACLAAGVIAVPLHRPESMRQQHLQRLAGIADDAGAACWLVTASVRDALQAQAAPLAGLAQMLAVDEPATEGARFVAHAIDPDDVAFLQYTSGSTSRPKGVMVTHANLMANEAAIEERLGVGSEDVFVSWLPLYHDMGLIGGLLQPLYRGIPVVLMSPAFFLERPVRWLEAISRHRGTISGGPDFAYRLCVDRIRGERATGLDLSCWRVAFSGAEPVRHDTLQDFIASFSPVGLAAEALYPCYGLAESTLLVSGGQRGQGIQVARFDIEQLRQGHAAPAEQAEHAVHLVACGVSPQAHAVRIADAATGAALAEGQVGEIWAAGPSIAAGYWRRPEDSAQTFVELDGQRWLRTGDLGFCRAGALFITGRSKDMIIVRGQNLYPQDIERAIESEVELVRKGRVAAFAIPRELHPQAEEGIGVALEISRSVQKMATPQQLVDALQECIAQACNEAASVIVLLNPGALPKTSSGKLQRSACREGWRTGSLDAYATHAFGRLQGGADVVSMMVTDLAQPPEVAALHALWERVMHAPAASGQAHFFRQGGNSLKAVQLAAAIGEHWQIDFPVRLVFEFPRLEQLAGQLQTLRQAAPRRERAAIPALSQAQREAGLPLSPAQHSLWTTWRLDPDSPAYNMPGILHLDGELDVAALRRTLDDLVARHAILRTVYRTQPDGTALQIALPAVQGILEVLDQRPVGPAQARALLEQRVRQPFALAQDIPLRACLVRVAANRHDLGITLHHIAADGQSLPVLMDEVSALYAAHSQGRPLPAPPALQFVDYALWRRQQLSRQELERQLEYWRTQLGNDHDALPLPEGRRQAIDAQGLPEARHAFTLPAATVRALRELCAAQGCTLYMGMLALLDLLLYRSTGRSDLRVGAPMAERAHPQTRAMIAYLLNLQVMRTRVDSRLGFEALLQQVRETVLAGQQHQDVSFDMVVQALQPQRQAHVHPLCQVKCTEREALPVWQAGAVSMQLEELSAGEAHFDLSLDFSLQGEELHCLFAYASTRWKQDEIHALAQALDSLAVQVCSAPALPLASLSWPQAPAPLVAPQSELAAIAAGGDVIAMWLAQAEHAPQALAVADERRSLEAQQLRIQVDQLALQMRALGVGVESRVAIASGRQVEFVIGVLACLRAGACYVPLDPQLPQERLAYQLADSGACLLLSTPEGAGLRTLPGAPVRHLDIASAPAGEALQTPPDGWPEPHPQQAAYLIYTSGSTGRPKGVAVSRGALANYVQALLTRLALPAGVRSMAMVSTVAADLGHTTFFGALCSGCALQLLPSEAAFDPAQFASFMQERAVDVLKIVPSHLQALLQSPQAAHVLPRHTLVVGGESIAPSLLQHIHALRPDCRVVNHYGPTETTVGVLTQVLSAERSVPLPLGQPLAHLRLQVLDADLNAVPHGAAGELYIGGAGLARGYHGKPGATAERFIADPTGSGGRLYRSGDQVRLDRQGRLIFLGRIDDQVKIRGYRVEPQEIAAHLRAQAGVSAAEVLALPGPDERLQLCAYVVGEAEPSRLRSALAAALPDYMVPARFVTLAQLPLTANGKIDRKALPIPQDKVGDDAGLPPQDSPREGVESVIAAIWQEVLGTAQVGRHDNFFALGGDSILTLKIVARLRKAGWRITPRQLMQAQDIAAVAALAVPLEGQGSAPATVAPPRDTAPVLPLTPIQQWFFQHHAQPPAQWNQSVQLEGPANTPVSRLGDAVAQLGRQHEALRLRFSQDAAGNWQQSVAKDAGDCFEALQVADAAAQQTAIARAQRSLALEQGPLWRVLWLTRPRQARGVLVLIAHHLVVDGVSWRILLEDLVNLLQDAPSPEPSDTFSAWAQALATARLGEQEQAYWQSLALASHDELPCTPAHSVGRREANTVANAAREAVVLDGDSTAFLLGDAHAAYRTRINDILLAALAQTLCEWTQRDRVLVEVEAHGREELPGGHADTLDLSRTVGWFTALYPLQLVLPSSAAPALLMNVKEQLRQVPRHGLGYGLWRRQTRQQGVQPQVSFNYLGRFDALPIASGWQMMPRTAAQADLERDPASLRRCLLDLTAMVVDGQLHLECQYCSVLHQRPVVAALLQQYLQNLRGLLAHCAQARGRATPSDFPLAQLDQAQLDSVMDGLPSSRVADLYPLSPMQAGLLFHAMLAPQDGAYLNQLQVRLHHLDVARFRQAWQTVLERHDILRSGFLAHGPQPLQWVARQAALSIDEYDWRGRDDLDAALQALAATDHARGVDLQHPPLMRLSLVRVAEQVHHLVWTRHHLLLDGWSTQRLIGEVLRLYRGAVLAAPVLRYRDYIAWLQQQQRGNAERFWRDQFAAVEGPTRLAQALPPLQQPGHGQASCTTSLDLLATARLQTFAREQHCTLNTLVQAAWSLVLQRYCGQSTVVFGATVAGRPSELEGADELLGLFINTVPIVIQPQPAMTVQSLLAQLQATNLAVREFDSTPLYDIQSWAGHPGQPLFDSILVFENYPLDLALQAEQQQGLRLEVVHNREETHYPLTLIATLTEHLQLEWRYDTALIAPGTAQALCRLTESLLLQLAVHQHQPLAKLVYQTPAEQAAVLAWSRNPQSHPDGNVLALIEAQVRAHPQRTALRVPHTGQTRDYAQLNGRANALAHWLIDQGVTRDQRVGVCMERSQDMVLALLAIMKAGAAYVPMDPDHPPQRLRYFIDDSRTSLLLTHAPVLHQLPQVPGCRIVDLATLDELPPADNPGLHIHPEQLAYVIYTSGSTGQPKGAANRHGSLHNRLAWMQQAYQLGPDDRVLQKTPFGFDVSVWEFFWPLMTGAELVMAAPAEHRDPERLAALIRHTGITTLHFVPSMLQAFVNDGQGSHCPSLRRIICSGEALPMQLQHQTQRQIPQAALINLYGPTEAAIDVTHWTCLPDDTGSNPPIGRPISATQTYVLDAAMQLVPPGVAGELYLGGVNLARAYLNKPGLTAERFVADPFSHDGQRLYRTGDLVRWREDGQLIYLGRLDHQVKLRGLRIELGEIEAALLAQPSIREAVVVAVDGQRLAAYVSLHPGHSHDETALKAALAVHLPQYMVPDIIVVLPALPLSTNGKIDRKALPAVQVRQEADYVAPEGPIEAALAAIWQEVLGLSQVGRHDNFLALGGDSILSLQIIARLRKAGWKITPRQMFDRQSIAQLSEVALPIDDAVPAIAVPAAMGGPDVSLLAPGALPAVPASTDQVAAIYPLSPMQTGMLFHSVYESGSAAYVNQLRIDIDGELDVARLHRAWQAAQDRHDVLRTGFLEEHAPPLQWVAHTVALPLERADVRASTDGDTALEAIAAEQLARGFDLTRPPLQRLMLVRTGATRHHFIWTVHHLLLDGWSTSQLLGEVVRHYHGQDTGTAVPGAYRDYIGWLQRQDAQAARRHWQDSLASLPAPTYLHQACASVQQAARLENDTAGDGEYKVFLSVRQAAQLQDFARAQRVTLNTVLQAAWGLLLQRYTGQSSVCFGATVAGRPEELEGAQQWLGLFINTLPVLVPAAHAEPVGQWLRHLQDQNLGARAFQHTPLYEIQRWHSHLGQSLFDSILVFENYPIDSVLRTGVAQGPRFRRTHTREQTNYPMTVGVAPGDGVSNGLQIGWRYQRQHFDLLTVQQIARHLLHCLQTLTQSATRAVGEVSLLTQDEQQALLQLGQAAPVQTRREPIHELFSRVAQGQPQAEAVVMGEHSLRYADIELRANRFARHLLARGLSKGTRERRIAVALSRSPEMIVVLLGILKAGAAYVMIDLEAPQDRVAYMLRDAGVGMVVTQGCPWPALAEQSRLDWLDLGNMDLAQGDATPPAIDTSPDSLAYVIYTSGSTGRAKGVEVAHGPLSMHIQATAELYEMGPQSRELHFLSFSFDGAHERWMTVLSVGGVLVLRDPELWTAEQTAAALHRHRITHAGFPPVYLKQLADWVERTGHAPPVYLYSFGGEAMPRETFEQVQRVLRPQRLINGYGPTETVVTPLVWKTDATQACDVPYAPIGRPVGRRTAMILDDRLQLLPRGVAGELYIGDEGLARGYLDRPGLTAASFLADPFGAAGRRMYRTGDLARWREDGQIAYLGRIDHQVKIKGFRIELGEVEAALLAQPGMRQAVAVVRPIGGVDRLLAYVSVHPETALDLGSVQLALAASLPAYMLPSRIIVLAALPLNANGKIDRKALPQELPALPEGDAGDVPEGKLESLIAASWSEVLGMARIGRHDNFFELGGDSILSLQIIARLRQQGWKLTPRQIFEQQTVAALAQVATPAERMVQPVLAGSMVDEASDGAMPLLPIQADFLATAIPGRHHWNQAILLQSGQAIDFGAMQQALVDVVNHHDALRMVFQQDVHGTWQQSYGPRRKCDADESLLWQAAVHSPAQLDAFCTRVQRSLQLEHGPLLRAGSMALDDGSWRLLLVVHHLVVDGVSWRILLEDLQLAYRQRLLHEQPVLPAKTASYRQWSNFLQIQAARRAGEFDYWHALTDVPASLPCDHPEAALLAADQARVTCRFDAVQTQALVKQAPSAYRTRINDLLLAALGRALGQWSGMPRLLITLEGHGREQLDTGSAGGDGNDHLDVSRTIGWFTSMMPVALPTTGDWSTLIRAVKTMLRKLPDNGIGYGLLRQWGEPAQREALQRMPRPALAFNYLGQFDGNFREEGGWQPAQESPGASRDPAAPLGCDLSINGQVVGGELRLEISYSQRRYDAATVEQLASRLETALHDLIAHCLGSEGGVTPSDFPLLQRDQVQLDAIVAEMACPLALIEDIYPATPWQRNMLRHLQASPFSVANVVQLDASSAHIDLERFAQAWRVVLQRHPILRTGFAWGGQAQPVQVVLRQAELPLTALDWRGQPEHQVQQQWEALCRYEHQRGFTPRQAPLMRFVIARDDQGYRLLWTWHHVLLDGWSMSQLLGEVFSLMEEQAVQHQALDFRHYIAWLAQQGGAEDEQFWRTQFARCTHFPSGLLCGAPTSLPQGQASGAACAYATVREQLTAAQTQTLQAFAASCKVTLNTLVQAGWSLVLQESTGASDVVFGVTASGRSTDFPGIERVMGMCINTLPLIQHLDADMRVAQWLGELQSHNLALRQREHVDLAAVSHWGGRSDTNWFDSLLIFENFPVDESLKKGVGRSLAFDAIRSRGATEFPLTVVVLPGAALRFQFEYDGARLTAQHVAALARRLVELLLALPGQDKLAGLPAPGGKAPLHAGRSASGVTDPVLQRHPSSRGHAGCDDAPVLVCIPAHMGNAHEYDALAAAIGAEHAVYQLLCPPHEQWRWASMDASELAVQYAAALCEALPGRRLRLLGWSVGGLLALETARQLRRRTAGEVHIDWIGLVDSADFSQLRQHLGQMSMPPSSVLQVHEASLERWLQASQRRAQWHALLAQMSPAQRTYFLLEVVGRLGAQLPLDAPGQAGAEAALWERIRCLRLGLGLQMQMEVSAPLHVWQAAHRDAAQVPTDWAQYAGTLASCTTVPQSDHLSILGHGHWHASVRALLQ